MISSLSDKSPTNGQRPRTKDERLLYNSSSSHDPVPESSHHSGTHPGAWANAREYAKVQQLLGGRAPTLTELGIFSVMWSEHCSYKSSRVHLKRLPTRSKLVLQGPGENAGIIDIGDGWACAFKIESHNHPSFIEPFQGATTGVGGILRDIFTMGARPVAVMDSLRFGPIESSKADDGKRAELRSAAQTGHVRAYTSRDSEEPLHYGGRGWRSCVLRELLWRAEPGGRDQV